MLRAMVRQMTSRSTSRCTQQMLVDERGQMAFLMVLSLLVVFMFFAFSFDAGSWFFMHRWTQNQTDAAAQAAALELPDTTQARAKAKEWLQKNGLADPDVETAFQCTGVTPGVNGWFSSADVTGLTGTPDGRPDVTICLKRNIPALFAGLAGVNTVTVSARTTAIQYEEIVRHAIMVMDPDDCEAFNVGGSANVLIQDGSGTGQGGSTYTYSNRVCSEGALSVDGSGLHLTGLTHYVNGSHKGCTGCIAGPVFSPAPSFDDPWETLIAPPIPGGACRTGSGGGAAGTNFNNGTHELFPGKYCADISVGGGARVNVRPGVYVLVDADLTVSPSSGGYFCVRASGTASCTTADDAAGDNRTLFYFTCSSGTCPPNGSGTAGQLDLGGGGGRVRLNGHTPDATTDYDGILFWINRHANGGTTSTSEVKITGGSTTVLNGHVYARPYDADVSGGSSGTPAQLNISIMANTLRFTGSSNLILNWSPTSATSITRIALRN
jgi:Flp pilus assembly protein TadG